MTMYRTKTTRRMMALALAAAVGCGALQAQDVIDEAQVNSVQQVVRAFLPDNMGIGQLKANAVVDEDDEVVVDLSENFADVPFTKASIEQLREDIKRALGTDRDVRLLIAGSDIDNYFADFDTDYKRSHTPFITEVDQHRHYKKGLDGNIVAVWPSHGWYFEPLLNRWEWQRARMFQTVEDMYTHSYMIPYIMPMLENAGAYVWDARERDTHSFGAVVDNDGGQAQTGYTERNGKQKWEAGQGTGFSFARATYKDFENPFDEGTFRQVKAIKDKKKVSTASWSVDMPEAGTYALYISYKTLPKSVKDAQYTVNSLDGARTFKVDQTMGGGVWVYLGSFQLAQGMNKDVVVLSNYSDDKDGIITADAIRVGGGKGNIVRRVALPTEENRAIAAKNKDEKYLGREDMEYKYVGSGDHPWFHIGSRYYLQWAGFPHQVYSTSDGINDYVDDYRSRGEWVNYLAGGSSVLPKKPGLNIPVDVSFCLHTDAGTTPNDDIIGTLLIYCTTKDGKRFSKYENGTPRELSRQFADIVSTEVVGDIRAKWEPNWTRRGMWDKSYYEARVPEVPALLMELLSHQNFADMKYGLDPMFRFDVSRAIYKGILKFIAKRDHRDYVVQPLPVHSFAISEATPGSFLLTWEPTKDDLSSGADAKQYVVLEQVGRDGGFKEVAVTPDPQYLARVNDNKIHSYKIIAMNDGGRSFPSETLSVGVAPGSKGTVMVVNGFTRVSGPDWFDGEKIAGFYDEKDHGVPYMQQINYLGSQHEFRRHLDWRDDDAPGFGACRSNHETEVIAGNTFDYPAVHGEAIMQAGYSFVSSSVQALEERPTLLSGYRMLDLILGKQKEIPTGRGVKPSRFKAFTPALMDAVRSFTEQGGSVLVSGAYVGTDIWDKDSVNRDETNFAKNVLGFQWVDRSATLRGEAYTVPTPGNLLTDGDTFRFCNQLNDKLYAVESPDAIKASDDRGFTFMRYSENNIPAGVVSDRGGYRTVVMGFPFEVMTDAAQRNHLMQAVLNYFNK